MLLVNITYCEGEHLGRPLWVPFQEYRTKHRRVTKGAPGKRILFC